MRRRNAQPPHEMCQRLSLVPGAYGGEQVAARRCRAAAAPSQVIDAEHAKAIRIEAKAWAHEGVPPSGCPGCRNKLMCGDSTKGDDDRGACRTQQPVRQLRMLQLFAMKQRPRRGQIDDTIDRFRRSASRCSGIDCRQDNPSSSKASITPAKRRRSLLCSSTGNRRKAHHRRSWHRSGPSRDANGQWLPRLRRAFPSAGLDESGNFMLSRQEESSQGFGSPCKAVLLDVHDFCP